MLSFWAVRNTPTRCPFETYLNLLLPVNTGTCSSCFTFALFGNWHADFGNHKHVRIGILRFFASIDCWFCPHRFCISGTANMWLAICMFLKNSTRSSHSVMLGSEVISFLFIHPPIRRWLRVWLLSWETYILYLALPLWLRPRPLSFKLSIHVTFCMLFTKDRKELMW